MLITAVDRKAAARGLHVGQRLADARALIPRLHSAPADPAGDAAALDRLADWCTRYTPWAAVDSSATEGLDGTAGLMLDITGCAHMFGGEAAMIDNLLDKLSGFGVTAHAAAADTPGAAWALARFDESPPDEEPCDGARRRARTRARLAVLPVEALRLPADLALRLRRLGLQTIGDCLKLPRAPLTARLGEDVLRRLDQMFGRELEPISPLRPVACWQAHVTFPDGIGRREDIDLATRRLLDELCAKLERAGRGARALELACYRVDGVVQTIAIGTSKPTHRAAHLMRLFAEKLGDVAPGFGIEVMILSAMATDPLVLHQSDLSAASRSAEHDLSDVIDRLRTRLGPKQVRRLVPRESHLPERAVAAAHALLRPSHGKSSWMTGRPRPVQLLTPPEPLEVSAPNDGGGAGDDDPPVRFRWRRSDYRVARAEGPERIEPEWWRGGHEPARDYFWVEDGAGRRFWIYRARSGKRGWYLHGLFA